MSKRQDGDPMEDQEVEEQVERTRVEAQKLNQMLRERRRGRLKKYNNEDSWFFHKLLPKLKLDLQDLISIVDYGIGYYGPIRAQQSPNKTAPESTSREEGST